MEILSGMIITEICELMNVQSARGREFRMHGRHSYGLSFCRSGRITYTMHGIKTVSDPDHAVLLPKNARYVLHGDEAGIFPLINFQCENLSLDRIVSFPLRSPESYWSDFSRLESLMLFPGNRLKAMGLLYEIFSRLSAAGAPSNPLLQQALDHLQHNYTDPGLSNRDLADAAGISEVYLRSLFSRHIAVTPKQYICDIRIRRAKQLLNEHTHTVTEISEACGFASIHHFCRAFKQKTGMTPLEYANQPLQFSL